MNEQMIQQMLPKLVPFVKFLGVTIEAVGNGTSRAQLKSRPDVHNHLATMHAGALYTTGESATGAVVLALFGDLFPNVFIALKTASVTHIKALPGDLIAHASVDGDPTEIRAAYDTEGRVDFTVNVRFTVDDVEVAHVDYVWAARAPRS